jgi:hypothetical protein
MFIPFGETCSPATGLRNLNLRECALPFDWIRSTADSLIHAVDDDFKQFHEDLHLSECKKYVIDSYGFEFPHDYPTQKQVDSQADAGEDVNSIREDILIDTWMESISINKEKYARRIERFISLMKSDEQLILLTTCRLKNIQEFNDLFLRKYNKTNIFYVVLSDEIITEEENELFINNGVCLCDPETVWVDDYGNECIIPEEQNILWKDAIVKLLRSKKIEPPACLLEKSL